MDERDREEHARNIRNRLDREEEEKKDRLNGGDGSDSTNTITIENGKRHVAADRGIAALVNAGVPFYQRDRKIQRIALVKAKNTGGATMMVPGIVSVDGAMLCRALGKVAIWQRFDGRSKKYVQIDPPAAVCQQILSMVGEWPFLPLTGIIQCPTLRRDGSLLIDNGYDDKTSLVLVGDVSMPAIPSSPSREGALKALKLLSDLLEEFPFVDDESKAVALSMLITPVVRGAMSVAPMHLVSKPSPGTGASYLADVASMISTGERCAVEAMAPKYEETEKRLIGSALLGLPIIAVDNAREIVAGDFFCQIVERPLLNLRPLSKSDKHIIANTFTMFANGNNACVAEDMVRRTVRCVIDANIENPEERVFTHNPLADIRNNRGKYIAAALTIPLAYLAANQPIVQPPLASFEEWSRVVRNPLIWLGCGDPVATQTKLRVADPKKAELAAVFEAWKLDIGVGKHHSARTSDLIETANMQPGLLAALLKVAPQRFGNGSNVDAAALGRWLAKHEGNIASSAKLIADRSDPARPKWYLDLHNP
jgi:putative DNA primase/helicase